MKPERAYSNFSIQHHNDRIRTIQARLIAEILERRPAWSRYKLLLLTKTYGTTVDPGLQDTLDAIVHADILAAKFT